MTKRVRVKPYDAKDKKRAERLERYLNAHPDVFDYELRRAFVNLVLYGPDKTKWPN